MQNKRRRMQNKKGRSFMIAIMIILFLALFSLIGVLLHYLNILGNRDSKPPEIEKLIVSSDVYNHYKRLITYSNIKYNTDIDFMEVLAFDLVKKENNLNNDLDSILKSYDLFTEDEQITIDFQDVINEVADFNSKNDSAVDWKDVVSALTISIRHLSDFSNVDQAEVDALCSNLIYEDGTTLNLEQYLQISNKTINYVDINFRDKEQISESIVLNAKKTKTLDEVKSEQSFTDEDDELLKTNLEKIRALNYTSNGNLDFIAQIYHSAKSNEKDFKIFTSLTLAQAILESDWGSSKLYTEGKNIFGIKAYGDWNGETIMMKTQEYDPDQNMNITIEDYFRKYDDYDGSIIDHSLFLVSNIRYTESGVFEAKNYKEQAKAVKKAGYATAPNYDTTLIDLIEQNELFLFDD